MRQVVNLNVTTLASFYHDRAKISSAPNIVDDLVGFLVKESKKSGSRDYSRIITTKLNYPVYSGDIVKCFEFFWVGVAYKYFAQDGNELKKKGRLEIGHRNNFMNNLL